MRMLHTMIRVGDLERSLRFYCEILGMRLLRRKGDHTPIVAALVPEGTRALGEEEVELIPGPGFPGRVDQAPA